ncbi:MAG TPA: hypothetical protein VKA73_04265 [Rubrobacter sp.]|nr:hypothetical protein [Rubrobacter sp.]
MTGPLRGLDPARMGRAPFGPACGATPPTAADLPRRAAESVAARFDTVAAAAEGCDAPAAGGMMAAGVWP